MLFSGRVSGGVCALLLRETSSSCKTGKARTPRSRSGTSRSCCRGTTALSSRIRVATLEPLVLRGDALERDDGDVIPRRPVVGRVVAFRRHGVTVRLDSAFGRALSSASRVVGHARARASRLVRFVLE